MGQWVERKPEAPRLHQNLLRAIPTDKIPAEADLIIEPQGITGWKLPRHLVRKHAGDRVTRRDGRAVPFTIRNGHQYRVGPQIRARRFRINPGREGIGFRKDAGSLLVAELKDEQLAGEAVNEIRNALARENRADAKPAIHAALD